MDTLNLMKQRHSVRQYESKPIEQEKRTTLNNLIKECNELGDLNIQIFYDEPECFNSALASYGSFRGVENYICLVGKKSSQLDETAGYYGEKIVLKAQELGLNTCWVALTHGKSKANVAAGEKETCIISLGYGKTQGVVSKSKDRISVSNITEDSPEWFQIGVDAALLAPTAINQQKFYFTLDGDKVFAKVKGFGSKTKLDLGIVKYHFEAASGHKVEG